MCNYQHTKIYLKFHLHGVYKQVITQLTLIEYSLTYNIEYSSDLSQFFCELYRNRPKKSQRQRQHACKSLIKRTELAIRSLNVIFPQITELYLGLQSRELHRRLSNITLQDLIFPELQYNYYRCLPMFSFLSILSQSSTPHVICKSLPQPFSFPEPARFRLAVMPTKRPQPLEMVLGMTL